MGDVRENPEVVDLVIEDEAEKDVEKDGEKDIENEAKTAAESLTENKTEEKNEAESSETESEEEKAKTSEETTEEKPAETTEEQPAESTEEKPEVSTADLSGIGHQEAFIDQKAFLKKRKLRRVLIAALITLGTLFVAGYFTMVILSYKYFQPNTVINGVDYSFRSAEDVQEEIDSKKQGYQIHVKLRNGEFTIQPEDIGLVITTQNDIKKIKEKQNPFLWFMAFFDHPSEASYVISYNKDLVGSFLDRQKAFQPENMKAPENPRIVLSDGKPEIIPGDQGTTIDRDKVVDLIEDRIRTLNTELDLEKEGCYVKPDYEADSEKVVRCRDAIETYTSLKITYLYGENQARFTLRPEDIYNMMEIDQEKYYCAVSKRKVQNFVETFAYEHDTYGKQRLFRTHFGKVVRLSSPTMGWEIDQEKEVDELIQNLVRKENIERQPMFTHEGHVYTQDGSDIGNSYVELDLTVQRVYFYMDGQLVLEDDIISGNPNKYQDTPGGLYEIYGMRQNVVLTGPGYASHVDYWMPFNGEIGLHDAYWQSKFGGNLYLTRGSHGCVNLPHTTAQTIYEMGYRGLPVVCYWRTDDFLVR